MWKRFCVIFVLIQCWGYILSEDCVTPSGKNSKCVSLYDCPSLASIIKQIPMPNYIRSFLMQSHCGFQGNIPKVCCGPLPDQKPNGRLESADKDKETDSKEDSIPASHGQCGVDRGGDRIFGGKAAEYNDFPWMALIGYKNSTLGVMKYECGGSLINQRYVLTAAHCVVGYQEEKFGPVTSVRLGEHDMSTDPLECPYAVCQSRLQEIAVASTHAHPGYNSKDRSRKHDIAIVKMAKRAAYTYYVQPICLVTSEELPTAAGMNAIVAGWGKTLQGLGSNIKMKLKVPIFNKDKCSKMFQSKSISLDAKQFCAGGIFKQDACRGDSGGPLIMKNPKGKWEAVGVISFGLGCGMDGWPGIYTFVGGYLDWIKKTLQSTN